MHISLVFRCLGSEARGPQRRLVREDVRQLGEDIPLLLVGAGNRHGVGGRRRGWKRRVERLGWGGGRGVCGNGGCVVRVRFF